MYPQIIPKSTELRQDDAEYWLISAAAAVDMLKARDFITSGPPQPGDTVQLVVHVDKRVILLGVLIDIIPKEICSLILPRNEEPTPFKIVRAV